MIYWADLTTTKKKKEQLSLFSEGPSTDLIIRNPAFGVPKIPSGGGREGKTGSSKRSASENRVHQKRKGYTAEGREQFQKKRFHAYRGDLQQEEERM